ncbi:MAG TPA: 4a-hydroxytetrahydrobiopterin dehydratase [Acidiferrobacteraceae bacterium]|nr:4a-hydroxytetrahydrobiopterin dehydratase [Acidiferrobacteraceae bacterium]HEX20499.1 4a-hydroxytetrahydrobiopterin dehydratase [Acidiferrobacteraceae bacterium]
MSDLKSKHCAPCEGGVSRMDREAANNLLGQTKSWKLNDEATEIQRTYTFRNYYETVAFVNAAAWIAHQEDHHADIEFGYKNCRIRYSTHAIDGLSINDFICAAKINDLIGE